MDYLKINDVAAQWGISPRRLQTLCAEGKIEGAVRFGRAWMIPKDAGKPQDGRTKAGRRADARSTGISLPRKTPFLHMSDLYSNAGSADNGGVFDDGMITWTLDVEAGESVTVTFAVTVDEVGAVDIKNMATVEVGDNTYTTHEVFNYTEEELPEETIPEETEPEETEPEETEPEEEPVKPPVSTNPQTGDNTQLRLLFVLLLVSGGGLIMTSLYGRKRKEAR